jgi:hypothetical protein
MARKITDPERQRQLTSILRASIVDDGPPARRAHHRSPVLDALARAQLR